MKPLTVVIKLGTSSIVDENTHEPILSILTLIVETAAKLHKDGHRVIIVSSGAVGVGLRKMDVDQRPKHLPRIQAWQCQLMSLWDSLFSHLRQPIAQILLTRNDIADRTQYINAQNTFAELLSMGVIPIVNENDTLAVSEIKFGDNDTLSAITAAMVQADYLFLMTDVDGLYTCNPRNNPDAQVIEVVEDISALEADVSTTGSSLGTGGMSTKIVAARLATSAGITTIITRSSLPGNISKIINHLEDPQNDPAHLGKDAATRTTAPLHTRFLPSLAPMHSRSFWVLHGLTPHGTLYIDHGAYCAILNKASLLPAGVVAVEGHFSQQEAVRVVVVERRSASALNGDFPHHGEEPKEVGRALVNYASAEIALIKGLRSTQIHSVLGYADSEYIALRENISFFHMSGRPSRPGTPGLDELRVRSGTQSPAIERVLAS
ncbi:Glutamate 5-kinase [Ophidiomyces ophidiicola]|uniref:Glutamate 5-kinase n=1 Tax=Ophidiomyces ophidiicola TaxID=1387563 RepID=A0ACB8V2B6_9EURO|nr:Glutamate 5-kinase [Ophidiomyces ophidiicola]KAI1929402.1 Glutamate 5-kinase [Ophidiomyces ophidiicola]KAI1954468.1 Glutamate 5-kinase [Ophidiomyces ophidiicola]KAI1961843.1 Glutamate 5-kinase [Ophidiomyces ophidiicola]KAI1974454.1 Glutamate 5-kinase [Ophidiomyces ophidiicola]